MEKSVFDSSLSSDGQFSVLRFEGEIDLGTAPLVQAQFDGLAEAGLTEVIIDAQAVTFLDSSGLRALIAGKKLIEQKGSHVFLVASRPVERLLEMVSPNKPLFRLFPSVGDALEAIQGEEES